MNTQWQFQVRVYFDSDRADRARTHPDDPALKPLMDVLAAHHAVLKCQYDAFAEYVIEAEREGVDGYPLYRWTRATLDDPDKSAKHRLAFAVRINGMEVYPAAMADALEADLLPLVSSVLTRVSKQDTNPTNNLPVPKEFLS